MTEETQDVPDGRGGAAVAAVVDHDVGLARQPQRGELGATELRKDGQAGLGVFLGVFEVDVVQICRAGQVGASKLSAVSASIKRTLPCFNSAARLSLLTRKSAPAAVADQINAMQIKTPRIVFPFSND